MDTLLHRVASIEAHAGKEITLHSFLAGPAGASLVELFRTYVAASTTNPYVERFRLAQGTALLCDGAVRIDGAGQAATNVI